jgi:hypothetical protein
MESYYSKQKDIIKKYQELAESDSPTQEEVLDLKQEINKQYHIMDHILRAQLNMAGKYLCAGIGGTIGLLLYLNYSSVYSKVSFFKQVFKFCTYTFTGATIGYLHARQFLSKKIEGQKNYDNVKDFHEKYDPIIKQCDLKIQEKLSRKI